MATLPRFTAHDDDSLTTYRSVSSGAVVGLILAVISIAAFLSPWLWLVPVAALAVCAAALVRIARAEGALVGRKAAWVGVFLATFFLTAAIVERDVYRRLLVDEARRFGAIWFAEMAAGAPQRAFVLTLPPKQRPPLTTDEAVWEFYRTAPGPRRDLEVYVKDRLIKTLVALGDSAEVRYYSHAGVGESGDNEVAFPIFAVTYHENGEKKTFLVMLWLERLTLPDGRGDWQILRADGGIRPE